MAYLLRVGWTSIDPTLESFTQNWIKGFLHTEIKNRVCNSKYNCFCESRQCWIFLQILKEWRCIAHTVNKSLQITFCWKNINWQADTQNWLTWDKIFCHFGENKLQDTLLIFNFLLMDKNNSSFLVIVNPFILPNRMPIIRL